MDFFKLGLRNVIGITLPGALLILSSAYVVLSVAFALGLPLDLSGLIKEQEFFTLAVFFLLSYILGMMMRLNAADRVDRWSSRLLLRKFGRKAETFEQVWKGFREGDVSAATLEEFAGREDFDEWVWRRDEFPYSVWQTRKFRIYHPPEVSVFFEGYKGCMGIGPGRRGKEFFNYCKMVVQHAGREDGLTLTEEMHFAEAVVRFYAGTFYALLISACLLMPLLLFQLAMFSPGVRAFVVPPSGPAWAGPTVAVLGALATLVFALALLFMCRMIVRRFRTLRLKEVDTVYDAFYLVHRHAESCGACAPAAAAHAARGDYAEREQLIRGAYARGAGGGGVLRLEDLTRAMRASASAKPSLASLYFAGAENDHPFFLQSRAVAVGLSVLPEDAAKAGRSKRHEHQREVIVVLEGSLLLDYRQDGQTKTRRMEPGSVHLIEKGQCHRIRPSGRGSQAVYLFVKTDPAAEPRGTDCTLGGEAG